MFILILWYIVIIVQIFFGYGTAYRLTKNGGDNGVALLGWLFVMSLAACIPGLGIYLWHKYRDENAPHTNHNLPQDDDAKRKQQNKDIDYSQW